MNSSLKAGFYVLTVLGTLICGVQFSKAWRNVNPAEPPSEAASTDRRPAAGEAQSVTLTNAESVDPASKLDTNLASSGRSERVESTNEVAAGAADRDTTTDSAPVQVSGRGWAQLLFWGFLGVASVAGLGALIAYEVSQYAGNRATESLFDDEGEGIPDSIDDLVEKAYADGDFLEAVRLLREHLAQRPGSVEAQIRIAELYEKDLNNPLAAALEYEEILKLSLSPEKRGWTSIHLVNLYNRLDKPDQAIGWLKRVVAECPGTPAAAKARDRLEAAGLEIPETRVDPGPRPESEPPSHLPPGFRPRGR